MMNSRTIACILVDMDLREGLTEDIKIEVGNRQYIQTLDYVGIPFKCSRCYIVGDCVVKFAKKSVKE